MTAAPADRTLETQEPEDTVDMVDTLDTLDTVDVETVREAHGPLRGVRVVDLTDECGALAGRALADLGATVTKVERPGGDRARHRGPLAPDGWSLQWWGANTGKRLVEHDRETEAGRAAILELVERADILVESLGTRRMAELGLDVELLRERNPGLVHVSVTPFGSTGPYADFLAADITLQAMGAHMYVTGDPDRPPLSIGVEVAYAHAGAEAAAAALMAYYESLESGRGQHVDVSAQQCVVWTLLNSTMTWQLAGRNDQRGGAYRRERGLDLVTRFVWECADGYVHFVPVGGGGGHARQRSFDAVIEWMTELGYDDPILRAFDWNGEDSQSLRQEDYDRLAEKLDEFLRIKSVRELYEFAVERRVLLAPVMSVAEILDADPQLEARAAWRQVALPTGQTVRVPGPFAKFSATPLRSEMAPGTIGADGAPVLMTKEQIRG